MAWSLGFRAFSGFRIWVWGFGVCLEAYLTTNLEKPWMQSTPKPCKDCNSAVSAIANLLYALFMVLVAALELQ